MKVRKESSGLRENDSHGESCPFENNNRIPKYSLFEALSAYLPNKAYHILDRSSHASATNDLKTFNVMTSLTTHPDHLLLGSPIQVGESPALLHPYK